ncbi:hypothetical protein ACFLY7_01050 [Patescibacteria group bacterium]
MIEKEYDEDISAFKKAFVNFFLIHREAMVKIFKEGLIIRLPQEVCSNNLKLSCCYFSSDDVFVFYEGVEYKIMGCYSPVAFFEKYLEIFNHFNFSNHKVITNLDRVLENIVCHILRDL